MGRECRKVHPDWEPEINEYGHAVGLFDGARFPEHERRWLKEKKLWDQGLTPAFHDGAPPEPIPEKYRGMSFEEWDSERPDPADYMPQWTPEEATHFRMFETVSEGSPVSPAFATKEELARWCSENPGAVHSEGTYEQWLAVCDGAYVPTGYITADGFVDGVAGIDTKE